MGLFDNAAGITSKIGAAQQTFGALAGAGSVANNLSTALSKAGQGDFLGAIRSANLPAAGELVGNVMAAVSLFSSDNNSSNWRVRFIFTNWPAFCSSTVL